MTATKTPQPLLRVENLAVSFDGPAGRVQAVNGVNLSVYPGQTLCVVGESGCGKSVSALSALQLVPTPPGRYDSGKIWWHSETGSDPVNLLPVNLLSLSEKRMQKIRGNEIAMIFQEPMTSLNPVYTVGEQILEAILLHQQVTRKQAIDIAVQALVDVGIADAVSRLKVYPHQMSGGMRQRIMIAMALACQPKLLLADEPTTALDVTIQAQILELLRKLQEERGMSIMLITHDLGVVAENADVVAVMYAGRVVEYGSVYDVFDNPLHPYTRGLFDSMPVLGAPKSRLRTIQGNVPNPANLPQGCPFHPRCRSYEGDAQCTAADPPLHEITPGHWASCWHVDGHCDSKMTQLDVATIRQSQI
ncbi:ABC transporter ATP-binding protein [bacterium AH-315-I18]|nr:ABC transporter ATP-binding protein [bacterium AH-315-I18]